jgi:hypothetical protein
MRCKLTALPNTYEDPRDGRQVLRAIDAPATPVWLRALPALQTLRQVWLPQCYARPLTSRCAGAAQRSSPPRHG